MQAAALELLALLDAARPWWQPAPFHGDPPWVASHPGLQDALLALADDDVTRAEQDPALLLPLLHDTLPAAARLARLAAAVVQPADAAPPPLPERGARDVPGRKWQQSLHFAAAFRSEPNARQLLDWCCGKAHLGRLLLQQSALAAADGVERDEVLCADGNRLARREGLPLQVHCTDALAPAAAALVTPATAAVALHACGDLHLALLRAATAAGAASLHVAPCCYHLVRAPHWEPLSTCLATAMHGRTPLRREDLRLAVQETVTAGARVRRQTTRMAAWRLGFDLLQRRLRGRDEYLPTPSRPARVLDAGFAAFCRDLAAHHGLVLPADTDFAAWEQAGLQRQQRVQRLELVRHQFRRPLEVLLVLDRALYLAEQGYDCEVLAFCPRQLTPRNLLLRARRRQPAGAPAAGNP